jgi:hypothetical protein
MVPADEARCARHLDAPAAHVCQRCGSFMCEQCDRFGVERRCPACRPRASEAIHAERRGNAVSRSTNVRCLACGYAGLRFDLYRPPRWSMLGVLPVIALLGPLGFILGMGFLAATHPCPTCGSTGEVVPGAAELVPTLEASQAWAAATEANRRPDSRRALAWTFGVASLAGMLGWGLALVDLLTST